MVARDGIYVVLKASYYAYALTRLLAVRPSLISEVKGTIGAGRVLSKGLAG